MGNHSSKQSSDSEIKGIIAKATEDIGSATKDIYQNVQLAKCLPQKGLCTEEIHEKIKQHQSLGKYEVQNRKASAVVFNDESEINSLILQMYERYMWSDPHHPDVFYDIRKMEAEVIQMCVNIFNGNERSCGTMTSGGAESILMACKVYRDRSMAMGISKPEMVVPRTAQIAFEKAAHLLNMKIVYVPVQKATGLLKAKKLKRYINKNTCMIVCACPEVVTGCIEPVEEISKIGEKMSIPVHVDCCLGGFLLPFMQKAGFQTPLFDFRLQGVTSISCDIDKYGFVPPGSSVIMYRNSLLRNRQFFVSTDWPGGISITPTIADSRNGALIAGCWAAMMSMGEEGYINATRTIVTATRDIRDRVREIQGLLILGEPCVSVIAIGSHTFDVYKIFSAMEKKGWYLKPLQHPPSFQLSIRKLLTQEGVADRFIRDLTECTPAVREDSEEEQELQGVAALYGLSERLKSRAPVKEIALVWMQDYYRTDLSEPLREEPEASSTVVCSSFEAEDGGVIHEAFLTDEPTTDQQDGDEVALTSDADESSQMNGEPQSFSTDVLSPEHLVSDTERILLPQPSEIMNSDIGIAA